MITVLLMVDGVLGHVDHVVRHVVMEHNIVLEVVIVPNLFMKEEIVLAQEMKQDHVQVIATLVRLQY